MRICGDYANIYTKPHSREVFIELFETPINEESTLIPVPFLHGPGLELIGYYYGELIYQGKVPVTPKTKEIVLEQVKNY